MTHYFIGQLEERNGEYEYQIPIRFTTASVKEASKVLTRSAQNWYGDCSGKDGDCYYFHDGEVCVQAGGFKEIDEPTYSALNGWIAQSL